MGLFDFLKRHKPDNEAPDRYAAILAYFDRHPFGTEMPVLTLLSALPPRDRCVILEALRTRAPSNVEVYNKLSMAYLKDGQYDKAHSVLNDGLQSGVLSASIFQELTEKIESLNADFEGVNRPSPLHTPVGSDGKILRTYAESIRKLQSVPPLAREPFDEFYNLLMHLCGQPQHNTSTIPPPANTRGSSPAPNHTFARNKPDHTDTATMKNPQSVPDEQHLFHAAATGNVETVRQLVARGVNTRIRDDNGWLPLDWALSSGHANVAFLLENSVDNEAVFLITAAYHGTVEVVRALLERGVNADATNNSGETALMFAALMGRRAVIELLLAHGADLHARSAKGDDATRYALAIATNSDGVAQGADKFDQVGRNTILTLLMSYSRDNQGVPRDPTQAVASCRKAAEQGNTRGQCKLAMRYINGDGVEKDPAQGVAWLRKAADQGYAEAQSDLGICYANGIGVEKDPAQAVAWYRKAADQGYAKAQCDLGVNYVRGTGVAKDPAKGVAWLRKAAEQGHANAQNLLGFSYANAIGVEMDPVQAVAWYRKAAAQGHAAAQQTLAELGVSP